MKIIIKKREKYIILFNSWIVKKKGTSVEKRKMKVLIFYLTSYSSC